MKFLIGIDEAGRGPLAGPVAVGAVVVLKGFDWKRIAGVRDSKQLSAKAREEWYGRLRALKREAALDFTVSCTSAAIIDRRGIVFAIRRALSRCLARLDAAPHSCEILLDGNLYAPARFFAQRTIIRGDESEPLIALASIAAKVTRDRLMQRLSARYPGYALEVHKGYGTLAHRRAIALSGLSEIHRASFCRALHSSPKSV